MLGAAQRMGGMTPAKACLLLSLPMVVLFWVGLESQGGFALGLEALVAPSFENVDELLLHYAWWPRLSIALLAGGGLGLAGVLMQQVLRNPLASPTTLGVASGANLALMTATLLAPGLLVVGREWVALSGGALAVGLVFLLSWRRGLAPVVVVLAGLVVNLYLGALSTALLLFNHEALSGLLIWGAGSLAQNGWDGVATLWPRLAISCVAAWFLLRPLAVLELDDASAKSLGVSLTYLRFAGMGLAVFITGSIVSVVGIIGFIGCTQHRTHGGGASIEVAADMVDAIGGGTAGDHGSAAAAVRGHGGSLYSHRSDYRCPRGTAVDVADSALEIARRPTAKRGGSVRPSSPGAFPLGRWFAPRATRRHAAWSARWPRCRWLVLAVAG